MVPVYSPTGKLVTKLDSAALTRLALPEAVLVRNRRGVVKRVCLKAMTAHVRPVLTRAGQVIELALADGHHCFAMIGVRGQVL